VFGFSIFLYSEVWMSWRSRRLQLPGVAPGVHRSIIVVTGLKVESSEIQMKNGCQATKNVPQPPSCHKESSWKFLMTFNWYCLPRRILPGKVQKIAQARRTILDGDIRRLIIIISRNAKQASSTFLQHHASQALVYSCHHCTSVGIHLGRRA